MSTTTPTTAVEAPSEDTTEDQQAPEFKNPQMRDAYYWAAQVSEFIARNTAGLDDEYYVEVLAGKPTIVTSPNFPAFDALKSAWIDEGFPTAEGVWNTEPAWNKRELDDETRYFVTPSDDRLKMPLVPLNEIDKSDFEHGQHDHEP